MSSLRQILWTVAGLVALAACRTSTPESYDVIIVGGGKMLKLWIPAAIF